MHLDNGLATPCMALVHGMGARCWLGGGGRGIKKRDWRRYSKDDLS